MYVDIENHIKAVLHAVTFRKYNQERKDTSQHPEKPWEVIRADMFTLNNRNLFGIADYHSKFPIVKGQKTHLQKAY